MEFFLGGKSIFTVQHTANGANRPYTHRTSRHNNRSLNPAWFISQMTGPDNENHYSNVGKINTTTGALTLSRISRFEEGSPVLKAARWVCSKIFLNQPIDDRIEIKHAGKCGRY